MYNRSHTQDIFKMADHCENPRRANFFTAELFLAARGNMASTTRWSNWAIRAIWPLEALPFVLERESQFLSLLERQFLHTVTAKSRPACCWAVLNSSSSFKLGFSPSPAATSTCRFHILEYPPGELAGAWKQLFHQLVVHETFRGNHSVPDPKLRIHMGIGCTGLYPFFSL